MSNQTHADHKAAQVLPAEYRGKGRRSRIPLTVLADDIIQNVCCYLDIPTLAALQRCNQVLLQVVRDPKTMAQMVFTEEAWKSMTNYYVNPKFFGKKLDFSPYSRLKEINMCFVTLDRHSYQEGRSLVVSDMFQNLIVNNMTNLRRLEVSSERKTRTFCSAAEKRGDVTKSIRHLLESTMLQFPALESLTLNTSSTQVGIGILKGLAFPGMASNLREITLGARYPWTAPVLEILQQISFDGKFEVQHSDFLYNPSSFSTKSFPTLRLFCPRTLSVVSEGYHRGFSSPTLSKWAYVLAPSVQNMSIDSSAMPTINVNYPQLRKLTIFQQSRSLNRTFIKLMFHFGRLFFVCVKLIV